MSRTSSASGKFPFWLGGVVLLGLITYTLYWFFMAGELRSRSAGWIEQQRSSGYDISYSKTSLGGYPFRFVLRFETPSVSNASEGWSWRGEELRLVAQTYNLHHILIFSPGENLIRVKDQPDIVITTRDKSVASVRLDDDFQPESFGMTLPEAGLRFGDAFDFEIRGLGLGLEPMPDNAENLKFKLAIDQVEIVRVPEELVFLGPSIDELILWLEADNFYSLIRGKVSPEDWRAAENALHLRRGEIDWGPLDAATKASVRFDEARNPYGTVGIHLEREDELRSALDSVGLLTDEVNLTIAAIAYLSQDNNFATLEVRDRTFYAFRRKIGTY